MKWGAWKKICDPMEEGGASIRNLMDVMHSFHIKFAWRMMIVVRGQPLDPFFKAKYIMLGRMVSTTSSLSNSQF